MSDKAKSMRGKAFGALKSVVVRHARIGFVSPEVQINVSATDRDRLRSFCCARGISLKKGLSTLLDSAGIPDPTVKSTTRSVIAPLIEEIAAVAQCTPGEILADRVRKGDFDALIHKWQSAHGG